MVALHRFHKHSLYWRPCRDSNPRSYASYMHLRITQSRYLMHPHHSLLPPTHPLSLRRNPSDWLRWMIQLNTDLIFFDFTRSACRSTGEGLPRVKCTSINSWNESSRNVGNSYVYFSPVVDLYLNYEVAS